VFPHPSPIWFGSLHDHRNPTERTFYWIMVGYTHEVWKQGAELHKGRRGTSEGRGPLRPPSTVAAPRRWRLVCSFLRTPDLLAWVSRGTRGPPPCPPQRAAARPPFWIPRHHGWGWIPTVFGAVKVIYEQVIFVPPWRHHSKVLLIRLKRVLMRLQNSFGSLSPFRGTETYMTLPCTGSANVFGYGDFDTGKVLFMVWALYCTSYRR